MRSRKTKRNAAGEYDAVRQALGGSGQGRRRDREGRGRQGRPPLGRALEAVGEALFYFAEQKKAKVDAIKFPDYKGTGTKDEVLKHIKTKVKDWIGKKKRR